jgi:Ca2+-binding EF-hand superfamily protein
MSRRTAGALRFAGLIVAVASLGLLLNTVTVVAQTHPDMEAAAKNAYKTLLEELDKDHDGQLSKAEFMAAWKDPAVGEEKYQTWDTNKDGYITEAEYVAAVNQITSK